MFNLCRNKINDSNSSGSRSMICVCLIVPEQYLRSLFVEFHRTGTTSTINVCSICSGTKSMIQIVPGQDQWFVFVWLFRNNIYDLCLSNFTEQEQHQRLMFVHFVLEQYQWFKLFQVKINIYFCLIVPEQHQRSLFVQFVPGQDQCNWFMFRKVYAICSGSWSLICVCLI